ncbi:MAG: 2-oxoacid:ferredoxin oxidoreductase subunit beta [Pseudomonadota bacterium]|nr:MAG: 2-oxoacid:ferredoxin oxidoreductase subunit beta [Pseudomonadota bacterium]
MSSSAEQAITVLRHKDFKSDYKPVWCAGCGDFGVLNALTKAMAALELKPENVAMIAGIGCSSRIPAYTSVYGFHGVHGRALPLATGLAISRPDLTVIASGGDGDGFSIGGNHFLHACRRNVNMTYLVMDNSVYGMTKGQASPTTEFDWTGSRLSPQGTGQPPLQPLEIALAAGAPFIARAFSNSPNDLARVIAEAIGFEGFAFVQILSPCITFRPEQLGWKKRVHDGFEPADSRAAAYAALAADDGFTTGILYHAPRPAYRPPDAPRADLDRIERCFEVLS